jgi:uncharacterized protein YjbI with pentapeptide repeats
LTVCGFSYTYFDYEKMQRISKTCEVEAGDNGLCIFHELDYLNDPEREEEVRKKFLEILDSKNSRSEPILCIGYNLPSVEVNLTFTSDVYLDSTNFNGPANFANSKFQKVANFYQCKFRKMANFSDCQFDKMANFAHASFSEEIAIFDHITFSAVASFNTSRFVCGVNFSQTQFLDNANFFNTYFYDIAIFFGVEFHKDADFMQSKFLKPDPIRPCTFTLLTVRGRGLFSKSLSYNKSIRSENMPLSQPITYSNVDRPRSYVTFQDTKVWNASIFQSATYEIESEFINATFSGPTNFYNTSFSEKCRYADVTFSSPVNFQKAEYLMECNFVNCIFSNEVRFIDTEFKNETRFENVMFEKPERVKITAEMLSNVSFTNTDITRVLFTTYVRWGDEDGFQVFAERQMEKKLVSGTKINQSELDNVSSTYRNLRENYEYRLRYEEAGKFFIKEMELKRKYRVSPSVSPWRRRIQKLLAPKHTKNSIPVITYEVKKNSWLRVNFFSLIALYWLFSTYGESIAKPTILGLAILILSSLLWLTQSNPLLQPNFYFDTLPVHLKESNFIGLDQIWNGTHWRNSFQRSIADFLPIINISGDVKEGIFDYTIKLVSGALVFGLLAIALRRKFERKYTR